MTVCCASVARARARPGTQLPCRILLRGRNGPARGRVQRRRGYVLPAGRQRQRRGVRRRLHVRGGAAAARALHRGGRRLLPVRVHGRGGRGRDVSPGILLRRHDGARGGVRRGGGGILCRGHHLRGRGRALPERLLLHGRRRGAGGLPARDVRRDERAIQRRVQRQLRGGQLWVRGRPDERGVQRSLPLGALRLERGAHERGVHRAVPLGELLRGRDG
jgi:hypothetical protein